MGAINGILMGVYAVVTVCAILVEGIIRNNSVKLF